MKFSLFQKCFKFFDKTLIFLNIILSLFKKPYAQRSNFNSIGIIKLSAMGDALCLMPAIRELKRFCPKANIIWLTSPRSNPSLFSSLPFVDKIVVIPYNLKGIIQLVCLILFRSVEIVLDFDQYYQFSEFLSYFWGRRNCLGFSTPIKGKLFAESVPYNPTRNEKLMFYDLARMLVKQPLLDTYENISPYIPQLCSSGIENEDVKIFLYKMRQANCPIVAIYPGSSANAVFRRWNILKYLNVANILVDEGIATVFIGGDCEKDCVEEIERQNLTEKGDFMNLIAKLTLIETASLIKNVDLVIGNDAGVLHLADALGVYSIGIFGPNLGSKWGSILTNSIRIEKDFPCRPCIRTYLGKIPQNCKLGNPMCLEKIEVQDVMEAVNIFFQKRQDCRLLND
jgi:ADP-heptose:LPS heptosyltransferase